MHAVIKCNIRVANIVYKFTHEKLGKVRIS